MVISLSSYTQEQILERLHFENPWWSSGKIDDFYSKMQPRRYYELLFPLIGESKAKRAVVLMGPRRVGKTVMMYHVINGLLSKKLEPLKIAFISIETPIYNNISLEQLFSYCRKATGKNELDGWYIFFDEIQYLKNWEVHLKSLVDSYKNTRFVVSGSAAAALKLKSNESGAGRFTDFILPPLSFYEYLHLKHLQQLIITKDVSKAPTSEWLDTNNIKELNNQFLEYINFGGYPEVLFSQEIQNNPGRYIRDDIIDKVLLRDLPMLYGINNIQELNSLFAVIAYNSGNEFSLEILNKDSHIDKTTIKKYIEYLEAAFLITVVHKISNKPKNFQRVTQFKIYLTNPSLRSALFSPLSPIDPFLGNMVETAIYSQYLDLPNRRSRYYARWQNGEVDMILLDKKSQKPKSVFEIKWTNKFFDTPESLKSLIKFLKDNNLKEARVTTIDKKGKKIVDGIEIDFVPASIHAYNTGVMNLEHKKLLNDDDSFI